MKHQKALSFSSTRNKICLKLVDDKTNVSRDQSIPFEVNSNALNKTTTSVVVHQKMVSKASLDQMSTNFDTFRNSKTIRNSVEQAPFRLSNLTVSNNFETLRSSPRKQRRDRKSRNKLKNNYKTLDKKQFVTLNNRILGSNDLCMKQSIPSQKVKKYNFNTCVKDIKVHGSKSIKGITVYKGPLAAGYSIGSPRGLTPLKRKANSRLTSFSNSQDKNFLSVEKPRARVMRHSVGTFTKVQSRESSVSDSSKLYKASLVLPGTSTLIVSQDILSNNLRQSCNTLASPFSSTTRSSIKRAKIAPNPVNSFS